MCQHNPSIEFRWAEKSEFRVNDADAVGCMQPASGEIIAVQECFANFLVEFPKIENLGYQLPILDQAGRFFF